MSKKDYNKKSAKLETYFVPGVGLVEVQSIEDVAENEEVKKLKEKQEDSDAV